MEVWNPADGSVTMITNELPPEEGDSNGVAFAQLLAINDGTELLLYGGNQVCFLEYKCPYLAPIIHVPKDLF